MVGLLKARKSVLVAFLSSALFVFGYTSAIPVASQSSNGCDNDYIIHCGVNSASEIQTHMGENCVANIYSSMGISRSDVMNMNQSTAPLGDVYDNGDVKVQTRMADGTTGYHLVATNAMTAGFTNISGSTAHMCGNTPWYERSPRVSFRSSPLPAFVMLDGNGQFKFAILKDCGNPVKATPVPMTSPKPQPTPQPTPKPAPKPTPTPSVTPNTNSNTNTNINSQSQTQTQSQSVCVNQTTQPAAMPASTTTNNYYSQPQQQTQAQQTSAPTYTQPSSSPANLPNTGPGSVFGLAGVVGSISGFGHYLFSRRRSNNFNY